MQQLCALLKGSSGVGNNNSTTYSLNEVNASVIFIFLKRRSKGFRALRGDLITQQKHGLVCIAWWKNEMILV